MLTFHTVASYKNQIPSEVSSKKFSFVLNPKNMPNQGSRPDYILARKWEYERKQVYVVQQTYTAVNYGNTGSINVTNNNGTMVVRREFNEDETNKIKRIKSNRQSIPEDQIRPSIIFPGFEDKPARQQEQIADDYEFINHEEINICSFTDHEEVGNLNPKNTLIRNTLLQILSQYQTKDLELGKTIMNSNFLNGIIDLSNPDVNRRVRSNLNQEQNSWLNLILEKQVWEQTTEFKDYCGQFTEDKCSRAQIPTLARKSFIKDRFDPYFYEGHDIAQRLMTHFSERLEAPANPESNASNFERTFAIDTTIFIMNRLIRMHQDVLDWNWQIDGVLKVLKVKNVNHQIIGIVEFSKGIKSPDTKDIDDEVKLGRNAMRILNKLLDTVPCEKARVYTIQCVNGDIRIRYMVRPLPSVYLYDEFSCIQLPNSFEDMSQFATD
ncbi:30488_t:CDS:10, partial [Gigaspora margarita]